MAVGELNACGKHSASCQDSAVFLCYPIGKRPIRRYAKEDPAKEGTLTPRRKAMLSFLHRELRAKYEYGNREHPVFLFGLFEGKHMIGLSFGGLQSVHGFTVNNCVETTMLDAYDTAARRKYAFQFVTNAAIDAWALPFDDIQCNEALRSPGSFDSVELRYEIVLRRYTLCE